MDGIPLKVFIYYFIILTPISIIIIIIYLFLFSGPIPNKNVNGKDILRVANFILARYGLPQIRNLNDIPFSERKIAIFSRTRNRLILNELDLAGLFFFLKQKKKYNKS